MQPPKTPEQIENMRIAGRILAEIYARLREMTVPGINELTINDFVKREIEKAGAVVTYLTPEVNFPSAICIDVNDEIVHSPAVDYAFRRGDVVKYDLDVTYHGMTVDSAFTMVVGEEPTGAKKHLLATTERAMWAGIDAVKGPTYTGTIGAAIEEVLNKGKLGIVRELVGHGIGESYHMEPDIPNYGQKGKGKLVQPGDTICIEPMAMLGRDPIKLDHDGWTYKTKDGSLAAHFEHTILVTDDGYEILTQI
ncbi:methionine aminopeptidase [Alphaproteobacteria bacterium]|nr:methionine aminopeptidase [Alphaproteobacteria bacterium]